MLRCKPMSGLMWPSYAAATAASLYINGSVAATRHRLLGRRRPRSEARLQHSRQGDDAFFKGIVDNFNIGTARTERSIRRSTRLLFESDITFSGVDGDVDQDGVVNSDGLRHLVATTSVSTTVWAWVIRVRCLLGDVDQSGVIDLLRFPDHQPRGAQSAAPPPVRAAGDSGVPSRRRSLDAVAACC